MQSSRSFKKRAFSFGGAVAWGHGESRSTGQTALRGWRFGKTPGSWFSTILWRSRFGFEVCFLLSCRFTTMTVVTAATPYCTTFAICRVLLSLRRRLVVRLILATKLIFHVKNCTIACCYGASCRNDLRRIYYLGHHTH